MLSQIERIKYLFEQYSTHNISDKEEIELFDLIDNAEHEESVKSVLLKMLQNNEADNKFDKDDWKPVLQKILHPDQHVIAVHSKRKAMLWTSIAAAAILFIAISVGIFFSFNNTNKKAISGINIKAHNLQNDIAPGSNKAVLTLANGSAILLDSTVNGNLAQQGNIKVFKTGNDKLVYKMNNATDATKIFYNTVSTPRGGQYQVVLSDGTKVWLNAASALRYPAAFNGKERNVELTGEAYFEVAKNAAKPFHVIVNKMQVEVMGTHFNIMAYDDESIIKTTLLEGSVKILNDNKTIVLMPGQQAQVNNDGGIRLIDTDTEQSIAWKNGKFYFKNDDISEIMKQLSRWYNAEIIIKEQIFNHYTGIINRQENISKVLNMLELAGGVDFEITGNTIIVTGN